MKVSELIEALKQLPPDLDVATGFPVVLQGSTPEYQESLCLSHQVVEANLTYDTWMGRHFAFIEVYPEVCIASA